MASIGNQILVAVAAALTAHAAKPAGTTVHRDYMRAFEAETLPAAVVYWGGELPEDRASARVDMRQTMIVELRLVVPAGTVPDDFVDPFKVWIVKAVMADEGFGGLASMTTYIGGTPVHTEEDKRYAAIAFEFVTLHQQQRADPETSA